MEAYLHDGICSTAYYKSKDYSDNIKYIYEDIGMWLYKNNYIVEAVRILVSGACIVLLDSIINKSSTWMYNKFQYYCVKEELENIQVEYTEKYIKMIEVLNNRMKYINEVYNKRLFLLKKVNNRNELGQSIENILILKDIMCAKGEIKDAKKLLKKVEHLIIENGLNTKMCS